MICPYCDSLLRTVPENGCCPNCNAPLGRAVREKTSEKKTNEPDMEYYYRKYRPDRIRAIMALRIDTGMDPVTAKIMIDSIFNYYDGPETESC